MSDTETTAILEFDGKEVTEERKADMVALIYIDNDEDHADDLHIVTGDETLMSGVSKITLTLRQDGWQGTNKSKSVNCGTFTVDDSENNFVSEMFITKAAAVTPVSEIRQTPKNQAWERFNLKEVSTEIARRNNVNIIYAAELNPVFVRKEQRNKSDIKFLSELCRITGLRLKFTNNSLVIYNPYEYSQNKPVKTFIKGDSEIIEDRLHHKKNDTDYAQCRVEYKDPITQELISYTYKRNETGRRLEVRQKVSSTEEAKTLAKYMIKEKNCREYTGHIVCEGDISLSTGNIITLSGYGEYDRKYIITKAIHKILKGIYTTQIFFEMVLEGY